MKNPISALIYTEVDNTCRKTITAAEIAVYLKTVPLDRRESFAFSGDLYNALVACKLADDCMLWDALELAQGSLIAHRPAGCPRSAAHMNALAGAGALCRVPPFPAVRCWWPYALGGAVVGGVITAMICKREKQKRGRTATVRGL